MNDYFTASRSSTPTGVSFDPGIAMLRRDTVQPDLGIALATTGRLRVSGDHLLMVVYDSVTNSVFESQVFTPLVRMIECGEVQCVTLATFESDLQIKNKIAQFNHPAITFIVLKRYPLLGVWGLWFAARQLMSAMSTLSQANALRPFLKLSVSVVRARGPLAGLIAKYLLALDSKQPEWQVRAGLTIQARGLCAEEYRFASEQKILSWWQKIVVAWRTNLYDRIEQKAYTQKPGVMIEVVSEALGEYLQKTYSTPAAMITLAQNDLVNPLPPDYVAEKRKEMRGFLDIPDDAYVFCYSGSCKPWQCAAETVQFFAQEAQVSAQVFLLILSQDAVAFQSLFARYAVPAERVRLLSVKPADLLRYLCAADAGMLLRQPDVVNWVSRPTKLLEYQAVGLHIIHNGTIAMLAHKR